MSCSSLYALDPIDLRGTHLCYLTSQHTFYGNDCSRFIDLYPFRAYPIPLPPYVARYIWLNIHPVLDPLLKDPVWRHSLVQNSRPSYCRPITSPLIIAPSLAFTWPLTTHATSHQLPQGGYHKFLPHVPNRHCPRHQTGTRQRRLIWFHHTTLLPSSPTWYGISILPSHQISYYEVKS